MKNLLGSILILCLACLSGCSSINHKADRKLKDGLLAYNTGDCASAYRIWSAAKEEHMDPAIVNNLGLIYQEGCPESGIEQSHVKALGHFKTSAAMGYSKGMLNTAIYYWQGLGVESSRTEAERWYEKASEAGEEKAAEWLASVGQLKAGVSRKEILLGVDLFNAGQAAYSNGNCSEAHELWSEAVKLIESPSALNNLGTIYARGCFQDGITLNAKTAADYYERSATRGLPVAMSNIADAYINGIGRPKSAARGRYWLEKASMYGHAGAKHKLSLMSPQTNSVSQPTPSNTPASSEVKSSGPSLAGVLSGALRLLAAGAKAYGDAAAKNTQKAPTTTYTNCNKNGNYVNCTSREY